MAATLSILCLKYWVLAKKDFLEIWMIWKVVDFSNITVLLQDINKEDQHDQHQHDTSAGHGGQVAFTKNTKNCAAAAAPGQV